MLSSNNPFRSVPQLPPTSSTRVVSSSPLVTHRSIDEADPPPAYEHPARDNTSSRHQSGDVKEEPSNSSSSSSSRRVSNNPFVDSTRQVFGLSIIFHH
jgi:hypothetical protein